MGDSVSEQSTRRERAVAAAAEVAGRYGLAGLQPVVLQDWNNTILRLAPAPLVAKVSTSPLGQSGSRKLGREVAVAEHLYSAGAPVVSPARDLPPGPHEAAGLTLSLWELCRHDPETAVDERGAAEALKSVLAALATYRGELPVFTDQLEEVGAVLADPSRLPQLAEDDRAFLLQAYGELSGTLAGRRWDERPLHGEAHLGNVLATPSGLRWLDFESTCRGPVEWDLSALPQAAVCVFAGIDPEALSQLRRARSLCVAIWCWFQPDRAPEVREAAELHLRRLRAGTTGS